MLDSMLNMGNNYTHKVGTLTSSLWTSPITNLLTITLVELCANNVPIRLRPCDQEMIKEKNIKILSNTARNVFKDGK